MFSNFSINLYLDTRRAKKNGKFPLKLRVFTNKPRKQKFYSTVFEFTESEFENIWKTKRPRKSNKEIKIKLKAIENRANEIAGKMPVFTFDNFEKLMFSYYINHTNAINEYYEKYINELRLNRQFGTLESYKSSLKSLQDYCKKDVILFSEINRQFLKQYELSMMDKQKSPTTISIYLRCLRAIFNKAIQDKEIDKDLYPFGKGKYSIPIHRSVKKALNKEQLKNLFEKEANTESQQIAKDFWFFSYFCYGINMFDIAQLQYKNMQGAKITFQRQKTANSNKMQMPVTVFLNDFTKGVIKKYGNTDKNPENLIFQIFDKGVSLETKRSKVKTFVKFVNKNFKEFAEIAGIDENITTYTARHSFATTAIRKGATMEFVSEALSHSNLQTTKIYFAGFEDEAKKEFSKKMLDF